MPGPISTSMSQFYIDPPYNWLGGLGWLILFGLVLLTNWRLWEAGGSRLKLKWLVTAALLIAAPAAAVIFPIQIPLGNPMPVPGLPVEPHYPVLFTLAGIPIVLAAGMLEPVWACAVGALTGLAIGFADTHLLFTMLEFAGLATLYSAAVRQRYRTWFFQILRHPLGAAIILSIFFAPIYMLSSFFATNGTVVARLDYSITQTWPVMLTRAGELIIASVLAEVIYLTRASFWGKQGVLVPSPIETSLQLKFYVGTAPLVFILLFALTIGDWLVAGKAAREMVQSRLENTAALAANSLPYFMEVGQNLLVNFADPDLMKIPADQLKGELEKRMLSVAYFQQLFIFDSDGLPVSGYPLETKDEIQATPKETNGVELALKGVRVLTFVVPQMAGKTSVQVSFITPIENDQNQVVGVLLGRTELDSNPFTQSTLQALATMEELGGHGYILDEEYHILYGVEPGFLLDDYRSRGNVPESDQFFEEVTGLGTRRMVYFQTMQGKSWSVVLTVPAERAQEIAVGIAIPLLVILLILAGAAFIALRIGLQSVAKSMQTLSNEATLISEGQLAHSLQISRVDEVGQVGRAFERMRISLKARLEELSRLLRVSQGVAANLKAGDAMRPVLEAAMGDGAAAARVVLQPDVVQDFKVKRPAVFGVGPASENYAYLDPQIFDLMRSQEVMPITNSSRVRRVTFKPGAAQPGAMVALALHHESRYLGAIWVAYEQPRNFTEEEIRFLGTLAGQAAIAASNASLYASAEIGRQRLEAVLVSTPEPVLVVDEDNCLLLLNASALQVPGLIATPTPGRVIQEVVAHKELANLILHNEDEKLVSRDISLANGRSYYASVSSVNAEGRSVGKVCVLQDITHFKELDSLKSDFVATVSHDLRAPLTLMRGYVTMLQMVGELNDQQKNYTKKIISGVENMSRLVNNLLDLGRIEAGIGLQIERVMAQDVVEEVLTSLQPQATQNSIQLTQEGLDQPPVILEADRALLQQAIYNLVENAIKYTPTNGQVRVRLKPQVNHLVIEVQDTGIGIAPLDLPRLFERFYRSSRREAISQRGAGLGLAIVKSIADRHHGKVTVDSTLGKGTTFFLEFPYKFQKG